MDACATKTLLDTGVTKYLKIIYKLHINALNKIEIVQRYVFSKVKWKFSICNLRESWVSENTDNTINKHYKKLLQQPISSNTTHLKLPKTKLELNIITVKQIYIECKLLTIRTLKSSSNKEANKLYEITSYKNIREDTSFNKAFKKLKHVNITLKTKQDAY